MPRSRVPIRGSIGKSILTGQKSTVVQQTIVQQVVKGSTSGVGAVAATIWPLISQIPINVSDLAALTTAGIVVDTGSHIIARTLAVNTPLTIANPTGAGGNPTISLTTAALTKTDDTNVTVTLGGTPGSALVAATSLTLGWTGQLAVPRGGSGAATLTGYLKGNGTSAFTANATIPATDITGLATVATTGAYSDLSGTPTIPADISGLTYVTGSDETADAPNSLQLIAGTNVTFDTSTPNQLKIDATGGGSSPLTTKGDLFGYDTTDARIPVGTDGQVLTADSADPLGVSWQTASGTGTVTSVDVTVPSILTISGNPITTSGTLAFDLATQNANLVLAGPTTGSPAKPTFRALVIADIPTIPAAHTSGFATVATTGAYSDLSGTPSLAAIATSGSATDLATGTVPSARLPTASTSVLGAVKVDGTSITISGGVISSTGGASGANPTASVGLTAVNGTATTFLRSDGAPALSQAIIPTWTGAHTFNSTVTIAAGTGTGGDFAQFTSAGVVTRTAQTIATTIGPGWRAGVLTGDANSWFGFMTNPNGGTDVKSWLIRHNVSSLDFTLQTINDAVNDGRSLLSATRSGIAISAIGIGNSTDKAPVTVNGAVTIPAPASGAALTVAGEIFASGGVTPNAATTQVGIGVRAGLPVLDLINSSAPAGARGYAFTSDASGSLLVIVADDAHVAGQVAFEVTQTSGTPTALKGWGPIAASLIDMTPDASGFTGTLTGMTGSVTNTCVWSRNGNQVTLVIGAASGTSNATTFTMTGLPAAIQPSRTQQAPMTSAAVFTNSGANVQGNVQVTASSGTVTFATVAGPWANTLSKGIANAFTITYLLN